VQTLELRPGGLLVYTMTAVGPAQIKFLTIAGLPLSTMSQKTFTEEDRLSYRSLIDIVPDHEPQRDRAPETPWAGGRYRFLLGMEQDVQLGRFG
jgi:hypothetical protein